MEYVLYSCLVFPANPNTTTTMEKEQRAFSGGDTEKKETSEWTDYRYVAFAENSCSVDMTSVAHEISERVKPRGEGEGGVAICAKTAYGKIDPRLLVEWFELAKIVGVSVVQVVYHEIPDNMLAVFRYYEKTGFVVLASITPAALKGDPPRHFKRPRDELQAWGDGRVVTNECLHRLGRHDYVFVSDFDELLLPSNPFTSLPQMLREAGQMYPSAGLFRVESHIVALNWDEVEPANPVLFLRHRRRSVSNTLDSKGVGKSSPKVIVRPQRVSYVGTHLAKVKKGYTQVDLPVSLHTFLHYRSWKPMLWGTNTTRMAAVNGTEVLRFEPQWLQALSELPLKSMGCDESYASGIALAAKRADHGKH